MSLEWYVALTVPGREAFAAINVGHNLRIQVFNPQMQIRRTRRDKPIIAYAPLFPGYLLMQFDKDDLELYPWHEVKRTPGIREMRNRPTPFLCGAGDQPIPLPAVTVTALAATCTNGIALDVDRAMRAMLRAGQRVRVTSGALVDFVGEVVWSVGERCKVLLALLGGERVVEMRCDQLARVEAA